jgi:hypothetical protein
MQRLGMPRSVTLAIKTIGHWPFTFVEFVILHYLKDKTKWEIHMCIYIYIYIYIKQIFDKIYTFKK